MIRLLTWTDEGELRLHEFEGEVALPAYTVLSHTWHTNNKEEVTYEDLETGSGQHKAGYTKIDFCKKQASVDELAYIWIDTCCINRKSEPELSEAVNSMFRWYKNATRCYVYLSDVYTSHEGRDTPSRGDEWEALFPQSRWFTRGWTLQELIAPELVDFFARDGTHLGNKLTLETAISNITDISLDVLRGRPLAECTIEERMMWAKSRTTKREEDHVCSLFGIFDVTMPLVYGEGKAKAFRRFYEEI
jgi:Heterokaryon incompatibility protein (HET)